MEYPSNSKASKSAAPEEPKVIKPVVTGEVVRKKPGIGRRLRELFIGGDANSVWGYIAYDILIPAVKDTLSDAVSMGIERMLFGDGPAPSGRRPSSGRGGATAFTNYNNVSKQKDRYSSGRREISRRARGSHNFDEIVLETRAEADTVIERLDDLIDRYNEASVSDLYELVGITGDFTDEKYGWTDMRGAKVTRARGGGYLINLPQTEALDN
jgi:hypothetical protein